MTKNSKQRGVTRRFWWRQSSASPTGWVTWSLLLLLLAISLLTCKKYPAVYVDPGDYTHVVDNQFFPLTPGTVYRYADIWDDDTTQRVFSIAYRTDTILGVTCCVATDSARTPGYSIGHYYITHLSYAQHTTGDVWRFGGRTVFYRDSQPESEESWKAGEDGMEPKLVMKSSPQVGDKYSWSGTSYSVLSTNEQVSVPYGAFSDCVLIRAWTFGGNTDSRNYNAPGIGHVLSEDTASARVRTELTDLTTP